MPNHTTNSNKYHGKPCRKCGGILRYKISKNCVPCHLESSRTWKIANRERTRTNNKKYRQAHYKKVLAGKKRWNDNNKEKNRQTKREYYQKNKEAFAAWTRNWRKDNPEKHCVQSQRRRALKLRARSEPYNFKTICNHYENKCLRCDRDNVRLTIDHIIPLIKGGDDIASNIQPLCQSCNASKHTKSIDYRPDAGPSRWFQKKLFSK